MARDLDSDAAPLGRSSIENARKRRSPRFTADFPVQVRVTTEGPTKVIACDGQGTDISGGGLAVTADIDLHIGSQIRVRFTPPYGGEPMAFRCFVRNREGSCYGVEFITENDEDYQNAGELMTGLAAMKDSLLLT